MPVGMLLPLAGNTLQSERFQIQIAASAPLRKQLWQQTVRQKIVNQENVLHLYSMVNTDCMKIWADKVKSGDSDNLEARAATYYWKYLFPDNPLFTRSSEGVPPNNMLNYGYAILRAIMARALVGSGLLPTLGIHHHNRYDAYCLADDIMEPYRPYVDELVIQIMRDCNVENTLTKDIKAKLLKIPVIDVEIEGTRRPLMIAASITTSSLYKCYAGEKKLVSYPKRI